MRSALSRSAFALFLAVAFASAVPAGETPCWKQYDVDTVKTVSGSIEELKLESCCPACAGGIHLIVRTGDGLLEVRVGPQEFLAAQNLELREGDRIEVTGSTIQGEDGAALLAREISASGKTVTLRDSAGFPAWAGKRGCGRRGR